MGACRIQYVLLLSLLGFFLCSDTLKCQDGSKIEFGQNFTNTSIEWIVNRTESESEKKMVCQEMLLLIDVGEKSLILWSKGITTDTDIDKIKKTNVFSAGPGIVAASYVHICDTDLCNNATSTSVLLDHLKLSDYNEKGIRECPVCLDFKGSCSMRSNFNLCPNNTKCYAASLGVEGGDISALFSIFGCLNSSYTYLMKKQNTIGIIRIKETLESRTPMNLRSHVITIHPSILLTGMFGLRELLSPLFTQVCPLC